MMVRNVGRNNLSVVASGIQHSSSLERMLLRQMLFEGNPFEAKYRKIDFARLKKLSSSFFSIDITSRLAGFVRDTNREQHNQRRGRGLFSLSVSRARRSSFVLVLWSMMMI
jgi:hypothetical protein